MQIRPFVIAAVALVGSGAHAQEQVPDPGHFFRTVYDLYSRQMQVGDVKGLTDEMDRNLSPKFVYIDVHGNRMNGAKLLATISEQLHAVQKITQAVITPRKVWKDGPYTKVLTDSVVKFQVGDQEGKSHDITAASTTLDTWFYRAGAYQLVSEKSLSEKAWRDHKIFGSTQVEHWQALIPRTQAPIETEVPKGMSLMQAAINSYRGNPKSARFVAGSSPSGGKFDPVARYGVAIRRLEREVHSIQATLARKPWDKKRAVQRKKRTHHVARSGKRGSRLANPRHTARGKRVARPLTNQVPDEVQPVQTPRGPRAKASVTKLPGKKRVIILGAAGEGPSSSRPSGRPKPNTSVNPG